MLLSFAGDGAGRNRLAMPDTMIPGCSPSNGASSEMVPRMRCRNWLPFVPGYLAVSWRGPRRSGKGGLTINTISAANSPPIECPTSTMSVFGDS